MLSTDFPRRSILTSFAKSKSLILVLPRVPKASIDIESGLVDENGLKAQQDNY
jgi:hypothetical protein